MTFHKLLDAIGWTMLFTTILFFRFFGRSIDNMVYAKSFIVEYVILGAVCSALVLFLMYRTNKTYFSGGEKRGSAILSYFFGIIAIVLFSATAYNTETAKRNQSTIGAVVIDKSKNSRYSTPYLTLKVGDKSERFSPKLEEWNKIEKGDSIHLVVGRGHLGYDYIFQFLNDM